MSDGNASAATESEHEAAPVVFRLGPGVKALVTGGGGFLGGAIVRQLIDRGVEVTSLARGEYPELARLGVRTLRGSVEDAEVVAAAVAGQDVVFHVAALPGVWGDYDIYYRTNFLGTHHVVEACRAAGVPRLVYTSTPSVVFDGRDAEGFDESAPYPPRYKTPYPETKAMAERLVLRSNGSQLMEGPGVLSTVALRPHLIWGPGDRHLVPRILERGRRGQLRIVGEGSNRVDTVYVDNAAEAHLNAAERLGPGAACAGRAYFISQGEPINLWEMINRILAAGGVEPVKRKISARAAYGVGAAMEAVYGLLGIESEPRMTRFVARELSTSHWFDISAARRDLGYTPRVSLDKGLGRLEQWLNAEAITSPGNGNAP